MNFDERVKAQQEGYLMDINLGRTREVVDYIYATTLQAANQYMNEAYSGGWGDGGAGKLIYGLEMFLKGLDYNGRDKL